MKLVRLHIEGFRGFAEKTTVAFDDLTVFVGKNDAGKSSILDALNIFFGESKIDQGDVNTGLHNSDSPSVAISCEFIDYPDELVIDASNKISPREEYLLNTDENIHLKKEYTGKTLALKTYLVANHPSHDKLGDLLELGIGELKTRAKDMKVNLSDVNQRIKAEIRHAIWENQDAHKSLEEKEIPIDKNAKGEFKPIDKKLQEYMPIFALFKSDRPNLDQDSEAQDPLKVAVKEIVDAQKRELDEISSRIRSALQEMANETVEKIQEMEPEIAKQLTPNVGDPAWDKVFKVSLTSEEDVPVNKRGSGVRRLILLSFLRVKAEGKANGKNVIYAIEEPETSQHPNSQKMLIHAFEDLADLGGYQVFVTTHTPMLAGLIPDSFLRYVKIDNGKRKVIGELSDNEKREIADSLGILPDNRVKLFLFVEGKNDINFLKRIAKLFSLDLSEKEKSGELIFIPMGGKSSLQVWVNRMAGLNKKEIYIYDGDNTVDPQCEPNTNRFKTRKKEMENYIHPDVIEETCREKFGIGIEIREKEIQDDTDVPVLVAKKVHQAGDGQGEWSDLNEKKRKDKESQVKKVLNESAIKKMTEKQLREVGGWEEIEKWMDAIEKVLNQQ